MDEFKWALRFVSIGIGCIGIGMIQIGMGFNDGRKGLLIVFGLICELFSCKIFALTFEDNEWIANTGKKR